MIRLGLTSFSEHDYLTGKKRATLYEYASHLPLVEMDTAYYGIPPKERVAEWVKAVPENFRFVMKVYSGISCQGEWQTYYASEEEMINLAEKSLENSLNTRDIEKKTQEIKNPERKKINAEYKALEEKLSDYFGTKVKIGKKKIEINYNNTPDLNRILEILNIGD